MDGKLIFCCDGVLRLQNIDENCAIPLELIQKAQGKSNFEILKYLRHEVAIETNTTLKKILIALSPWSEIFKDILDRDVPAYITHVRRPTLVTDEPADLDWIGVYHHIDLLPTKKQVHINHGSATPSTGDLMYNIDHRYTCSGFKEGSSETWDISFGISSIKDLPVKIHEIDQVRCYKLAPDHAHNPHTIAGTIEDKSRISFIAKSLEPTLLEFLEALLVEGLFYYSPEGAQLAEDQIKSISENFKSINLEDLKTILNDDLDEMSEQLNKSTNSNDSDIEVRTIMIDQDAFDPIFDDINNSNSEWLALKKACSKINDGPAVRVGSLKTSSQDIDFVGNIQIKI